MSDIIDVQALKQLTDSQLAGMVRKGNDRAFEEIAERYIKFLYSLSSGFRADGFDKNDFVQEGLLILFAACKTYNEKMGISFKNYLSICVRRRYISIQRSSNAKGKVPQSNIISMDEAADSADYSLNPEELLINKEHFKSFMSDIEKKLSPLEQSVLSYYIAGCSYTKIAEKTGLSVKSVDNALQRVRKKCGLYAEI